MSGNRADAFRVDAAGDEVLLEFGARHGQPRDGAPPPVQVTDRMLLPPAVARRLVAALGAALPPVPGPTEAADGLALQHAVANLPLRFHLERSWRFGPRSLQAQRFLMTQAERGLTIEARAACLALCARLGMPAPALAAAQAPLAQANIVHFGFEAGPAGPVYKFYMERRIPLVETQRAAAAGQPVPQHVALKWQPGGRCVTGTYLWFPGLSPAATIARLGRLFDSADPRPLHLAQAALGLAVPVLPPSQMQYLEVMDEGTPRRSFDFKYYGSGLLVRDVLHLLNALRDHFRVPLADYQAMLDQARDLTLGHIAGGLHRDGAPFFTLYAGPPPNKQ